MLEKLLYVIFGGLITALGFFARRRIEQRPMFEQIDKQQKLLDLIRNLEAAGTTLDDLKALEDTLLGKASSAKTLAQAYEDQAAQIYVTDAPHHMTQADMNQHAAESFHRADERLNNLLEQLRAELDPISRDVFEKSHQAWLAYREATATFQSNEYEGGSIQPLIHAAALESATIARIVELEPLLRERQAR